MLLILLAGMLYPALALRRVVAPETSLRGRAPWRAQWGPFPAPPPEQVRAATELGARLTLLERDTRGIAVWNPWIGGGRPGWIASAREGGSPLPLLAVALSRPGRTWTGLLALELAAAFLSCSWMLRRLDLGPWPAAFGAFSYALAGPVACHWLDWQASALALGPLGVAVALSPAGPPARRAACWGGALAILGSTGAPALPFAALAAAAATFRAPAKDLPRRLLAAVLGTIVAGALLAPRLWLAAAGRESGAPPQAASLDPPISGLAALAFAPARFDPAGTADAQRAADGRGFLGPATLALAALGLAAAPLRQRGLWGGTLVVGLLLAAAPKDWLERAGVVQRPLAALALAAATLAAFGLARLLRGLDRRRHALVGAPAVALAAWSLLPAAARHVPFATPEEAALPAPLPPAASQAEPRVLGLLGCLPPDLGAACGLADVRASFFAGEPRYVGLLGGGPDSLFSVSRALSREAAELGAGTLLEPLPLRVVSNEIYSRIEAADLPTSSGPDGRLRAILPVSPGTCRIGVSSRVALAESPALRLAARTEELAGDAALAGESDEWRWFALPRLRSPAAVALSLAAGGPASVQVALDRSGLRLAREGNGLRVWSWELASAFATLTWPAATQPGTPDPCPGHAVVREAGPERVSVTVSDSGSCSLLLQVKHRPRLWWARVNGQPAQSFRCAEVWTCVPVPAGDSSVELEAGLPRPALALSLAGLVALAGLAWLGRKA